MNAARSGLDALSSPIERDFRKVIGDLDSAASALQAFIDQPDQIALASLSFIPPIIRQAQETVLKAEAILQNSETNLQQTRQMAQSVNELKTLLDVLPIGIVVSHDPENQNMTINSAGLRILGLAPGRNPSRNAPGGDSLPFKILRAGQEVPLEELPMQYAVTHRVALRDVELDIQHSDGKVINVLEYASPLFDDHGAVIGSLGLLVDITGRKSIEQRLMMQYTIARVLAESDNINKAAAQVLQLICETAGWEYGALWRVEDDNLTLTNEGVWYANNSGIAEHAEATRYSVKSGNDTSLPGFVLQSGQALWLSSLQDFHSKDAIEAEKAGLRSAFIMPVRSRNKVIAILETLSIRSQVQDQNLTAMLTAVGNQIGIFIERKQLEEVLANRAKQLDLIAQAGIALITTLDYKKRLETIARVIVPDLADWCDIDVLDRNKKLQRVASIHVDSHKEKLVNEIPTTWLVDINQVDQPQVQSLLAGESLLYPELSFSQVEATVVEAHQADIIQLLDPISAIVVPLIARDQFLGICTFVQSDSGRRYSSSDLALAEDIVHRVALALDSALLYAESQKLNADLEHRVEERTNQLKLAINQLTNQIAERQRAEDQIRMLNAELEQRIAERTSQLEKANRNLQKEILNHQEASQTLRKLLKRTRELYRISQSIGTVRTPNELLGLLLSSTYLKNVSRSSIAILDEPWMENAAPPEHCFILAEWNKGSRQPRFINQVFTLEEYGVTSSAPFGKPIVIQDIQAVDELSEVIKKRFADLRTHGLIILPLIAGGEWFGLISLHFKTSRMPTLDDLRHVRGLVDETAILIKNVRLLEAESQARQEAERANELKLKFLGMISHELRTPLTSIKGFATTLLAGDVVWPENKQREFLETINDESDKLHDLIEQLLDLSRMEAGILRILPVRVSLSQIIDLALAQLRVITTDHQLVLKIPPVLPPIFGDEQRIAQVITNLVNNAAKFSPPQTQITISAYQKGSMIQVDVTDLGPGIPRKDAKRVFEAFRQLEDGSGNRTRGAGLGLAICKGLIEAHKGKIWVQMHRGLGTIISFTLPVFQEISE